MISAIVPHHPGVPRLLHHVALAPMDMEASLRFYRDGIGLEPLMDEHFKGPWRSLFRARSDRVRAIFLGDPRLPEAGIVELVAMDRGADAAGQPPPRMAHGFGWLSFWVDVDAVVARLRHLQLDRELQVTDLDTIRLATVRDPDGLVVELMSGAALLTPGS